MQTSILGSFNKYRDWFQKSNFIAVIITIAMQNNMSLSREEEEETKEPEIKRMFSNILTELKTLKE